MSCFLFLSAFLLASPARGQDVSIQATVNRDRLSLDGQAVLTVTVTGRSNLPTPRLPSIPNFNVHSAGHSTNMSFINGRITSSARHSYILVPRLVGRAVIGPITVSAGGKTARTAPIEITVVRPSAAGSVPAARPRRPRPPRTRTQSKARTVGPDLFVTASVDKKKPFINEQVLLTVRFYTGVPLLGNAEWVQPDTHGFLDESLPPGEPQKIHKQGRAYYINEIKMALFPLEAGQLKIGPTTIRCKVQESMDVDPFAPDFFQRFFSQGLMSTRTRELKTRTLRILARPLPEKGKPAGFSGAVGSFNIKATVDGKNIKAGDAVTLSVAIKGRGNLKTLGELRLPELKNFRVYETVSSLNLEKDPAGVHGAKTYKTVLVPHRAGEIIIPPVTFAFFDPARKKYRSIKTRPIRLKVAPGEKQPPPVGFRAGANGAEITRITADIRHIKSSFQEPLLQHLSAGLTGLLWLHVLPSLIFLTSMGISVYRNNLAQNPAAARFKRAAAKARTRVAKSRSQRDSAKTAGILAEALSCYLSDKLDRPASSLTLRDAQHLLSKKFPGLPAGHLDRMKMLWEELDLQRFAPKGGRDTETGHRLLADGVRELIDALEEELKT